MKNDGGSAFPSPGVGQYGMSLRDWFAGQALTDLVGSTVGVQVPVVVKAAYEIADAMIAEREKQAEQGK